jgi:hypothetical protein
MKYSFRPFLLVAKNSDSPDKYAFLATINKRRRV